MAFPTTKFQTEIVPIIPVDAVLAPGSTIGDESKGKIPGRYDKGRGVWSGYRDWTRITIDANMVSEHGTYPTSNWGLRSAKYPGIDVDSNDAILAELIEATALEVLGAAPVRYRDNSPRRLLAYRVAEGKSFGKMKLRWRAGDGAIEQVEVLARGQQYVVAGHHATGAEIKWRGGDFDALSIITPEQITVFFAKVAELVGLLVGEDAVLLGQQHTQTGTATARLPIGHPDHLAHDLGQLGEALMMIPNNLDYDDWIPYLTAAKAACGGNERFYPIVEQWSRQWDGTTAEIVRYKWDRIVDSEKGADFIFRMARENGYIGTVFDAVAEESGTIRPVIRIRTGQESMTLLAVDKAFAEAGRGFYRRGSLIVKPIFHPRDDVKMVFGEATVRQPRVATVPSTAALIPELSAAAAFQKYDGRKKEFHEVTCPESIARGYLDSEWAWLRLPMLKAIVHTPLIRLNDYDAVATRQEQVPVIDTPGYDAETEVLFQPQGVTFAPIPRSVSEAQARQAFEKIDRLLGTFAFRSEVDLSVALTALVTTVLRSQLPSAPLFAFSAPTAGSGKSYLVDVCVALATGRNAPVIATGKTDEEMEKRLGACLIEGEHIAIDNVERPLGGEFLCQMMTQQQVRVRVLGYSKTMTMPTTVMVFATGNNLILEGDMARRALVCTLDPGCERPELRQFTSNVLRVVKNDRGQLVVDILTALIGYLQAGAPGKTIPLGSFALWSRCIRDFIIWLGYADPCRSMDLTRDTDPRLETLRGVLSCWHAVFGDREMTARDVIDESNSPLAEDNIEAREALREALMAVARDRREIDSQRLGIWCRRNMGRVVDGRKLVATVYSPTGTQRWRVVPVGGN